MEEKLDRFDTLQPILILLLAGIGLFIGRIEWLEEALHGLEDPLLMVLLFIIFLDIDWHDVIKAFQNVQFTLRALLMNFIFAPFVAFILSRTVLAGQHALQLALIMLLVMPCTDWYLVFTGMSGGNLSLSSAILPIQLLLQLFLLPFFLTLFVHGGGDFDFAEVSLEVLSVVLIPFLLSIVANLLFSKIPKLSAADQWLDEHMEILEFSVMSLIVLAIFATEGQEIFEDPSIYPLLLLSLLIYYILSFCISWQLGKGMPLKDRISLVYTSTARNSHLSIQSSVNLVISRHFACFVFQPYVFSLVFALTSRNKGKFF